MKRLFDFIMSLMACIVLSVPMLIVALLIKVTSKGPVLYWSDRVGKDNKIFSMPKFRTMLFSTPAIPTHLMSDPDIYLTPIGKILRRMSIDELPQLLSVLKGDMSIVGPRPALFNQADLIAMRTEKGIHRITPGLSGPAQINGRDDLPIPVKVEFDEYYLKNCSFIYDLEIIYKTILLVFKGEGVSH